MALRLPLDLPKEQPKAAHPDAFFYIQYARTVHLAWVADTRFRKGIGEDRMERGQNSSRILLVHLLEKDHN